MKGQVKYKAADKEREGYGKMVRKSNKRSKILIFLDKVKDYQ